MDINRINEINAEVHQSTDLDGALSVYNLLKSNGYEIKSNMGSLMDYCKTRGLDRVKSNIELLVRYDEELGNKEKVTKDFYASIYSNDKSGILDRIEGIVNADTKYNVETDARHHGNNKPDNGKSIFTMKIEELKRKMGGDNVSSKLEKARKSLEDNYTAFRNLTAEDLKSTKALKLREAIDQNRYYINQLEGMSSRSSYSIDSIDKVNAFNADVKELYNFINGLNLNDDSKKALIDEFGALRTKINDYRNYIANLQATGKKYDALLAEMDVVKVGKSVKKSEVKAAPEEKKEEKVEPVPVKTEKIKEEVPKTKVEEKPAEVSDKSDEVTDEKEKHDYKVKSVRKTVGKYAPWVWRTAAIIGIASSTFTPAVVIAGGWLAAEAIRFCVKRNYRFPKFGLFKDKLNDKFSDLSQKGEISEEESKDAAAVASEIDKAAKEAEQVNEAELNAEELSANINKAMNEMNKGTDTEEKTAARTL